jgi:hypothetical protein
MRVQISSAAPKPVTIVTEVNASALAFSLRLPLELRLPAGGRVNGGRKVSGIIRHLSLQSRSELDSAMRTVGRRQARETGAVLLDRPFQFPSKTRKSRRR